ncbi:C40 family peptidase [Kineococcus auxinigenes]|uniref:C40 family peptidase n=1 Tax=unclassified Kineococcus TaxID=2621656 RepID=UPI003D7F17FE
MRRGAAVLLGAALLLPCAPLTAAAEPSAPSPTATATATATSTVTSSATSSAVLRERAARLRERVAALRLDASVATEEYGTAVEEVRAAVHDEVVAQSALDRATGTRSSTAADAVRRVRSLYVDGGAGQLGLARRVSGALATGSLDGLHVAAVADRAARAARSADVTAVAGADAAGTAAAEAADRLERVRAAKSTAQTAAAAARDRVQAALAEQERLLADADAAVVSTVAAEEERARAAALATAAATAARAGVADAGTAGATTARTSTRVADAVTTGATTGDAAQDATTAARTRLGLPYVWGATGPGSFDCSGLTQWAYRQAGTAIPRTSRQQYAALPKVPLDALLPGDLVFYASGASPSSIHHVALYLGGGRVLHAPHTGDVVREAGVAMPGLYGAVRPTAG